MGSDVLDDVRERAAIEDAKREDAKINALQKAAIADAKTEKTVVKVPDLEKCWKRFRQRKTKKQ